MFTEPLILRKCQNLLSTKSGPHSDQTEPAVSCSLNLSVFLSLLDPHRLTSTQVVITVVLFSRWAAHKLLSVSWEADSGNDSSACLFVNILLFISAVFTWILTLVRVCYSISTVVSLQKSFIKEILSLRRHNATLLSQIRLISHLFIKYDSKLHNAYDSCILICTLVLVVFIQLLITSWLIWFCMPMVRAYL